MLPLLLILFMCRNVAVSDITINNASDFSSFATSVNEGRAYSGETVYLGADIALSGTFDPIGFDGTNIFSQGTFDGQGHTISGLVINTTSYAGMFGFSDGLTVRNVVLDSTCSVEGTASVYAGGFVGFCYSDKAHCRIENSVNMANVTFSGNGGQGTLLLGGFVGYVSTSEAFGASVKNCANYGTVMDSGTKKNSNIGGIVGGFETSYDNKYIQNCLNYGEILHTGTKPNELNMGGIVGFSKHTQIGNCLNSGVISATNVPSESHYGNVVGKIEEAVSIEYCFWTRDTYCGNLYGAGTPTSMDGSLISSEDLPSAVEKLNGRVKSSPSEQWSGWLLNTNRKTVTFKVNSNKDVLLASQAILLPSLVPGGGLAFGGWFKDSEYKEPFKISEITEDTTLHGLYNEGVTVTFNPNGGTVTPTTREAIYKGAYNLLPTPTRAGYNFTGWFNDNDEIITNESTVNTTTDHTLQARWIANSYTVEFISSGLITEFSKTVTFDSTYGELPSISRTGYTFIGWFNEYNENITSESKVKIPKDHALNARWDANTYVVSFDFSNGTVIDTPLRFNENISYPEATLKEGHIFIWCEPKPATVPDKNVTILGRWTVNSYIVTFDPNGGVMTELSRNVAFNSTYGELPSVERTGYAFVGWFNEHNENITSESKVRIPKDHTLQADWAELPSQIEIIIGSKGLTEERIHEIIGAYTEEKFTILKIEDGKEGETRVIIKFADSEKADAFVRAVEGASESTPSLISRAGFNDEKIDSLSAMHRPLFHNFYSIF